tara:strand:- start:2974 stop:3759 length:786 start_codon:yes stop_codon:yes gene_type:complete
MQTESHRYLLKIQFLGFRYSGYQKQPGQRTIEAMLMKTLKFILPDQRFKILGAGRTDAKVSALDYGFELSLVAGTIKNLSEFLSLFNRNLPADIRAVDIVPISGVFNIIQNSKVKEYVYLFSFGEKNHPFCAPFMANILDVLDVSAMQEAARLFEGTHDFATYTARLRQNAKSVRQVVSCEIVENNLLKANFFPEESFALHIKADGFMRYQVRMIMGALIQLGRGELDINDIRASLEENNAIQLTYVAPGSGLLLNNLEFE